MAETKRRSSRRNSFRIVKRGFDPTEVDEYLAHVDARQIAGDPVDQHELLNKMFAVTKRGYDRVYVAKELGKIADQQTTQTQQAA